MSACVACESSRRGKAVMMRQSREEKMNNGVGATRHKYETSLRCLSRELVLRDSLHSSFVFLSVTSLSPYTIMQSYDRNIKGLARHHRMYSLWESLHSSASRRRIARFTLSMTGINKHRKKGRAGRSSSSVPGGMTNFPVHSDTSRGLGEGIEKLDCHLLGARERHTLTNKTR